MKLVVEYTPTNSDIQSAICGKILNKTSIIANNINFGPEPDTVSYLIKMGAKVAEIQAKMDERIAGQSYLNAVNAAKYMARMLISILLIQNFRNKKKVDFTK